ncbi:MAG: PAS domain S-box protein [Nitrospirota bacterium]|nr:PAS domain S-box protein [Nitrospirota bacterium]
MAKTPDKLTKATALRRQAEELLRATNRDIEAMPVKDVQQLVHELQVQQIELEMQNDELRRAQMALEAARDRYVALYDSAPVGYLTLDLQGTILGANLPACKLLGVNRKDLLGEPVIRFVARKDQPMFHQHLREPFDQDIRHVCAVDLIGRAGVPVPVQFESVAVQDEEGRHTRILSVLENITERKRVEALEREQQQGLERQRSLEQRVKLSHDLHDGMLQSLYAIGLGLERCKLSLPKSQGTVAGMLTQGIGALNEAMGDVRTFMQELESRPLPTAAQAEADLSASLRAMAGMLARLHGQTVRVSVDDAAEAGLSQAQRLELLKLAKEALSNSFRHAKATVVQVSLLQRKGAAFFVVRDNGAGFDRKARSTGGRGLVNMEARAARLGATLTVRSKSQQGTCLVLNLSTMQGLHVSAGQEDCPLRTPELRASGSRRDTAATLQTEVHRDSLCACPFDEASSTCALGEEAVEREG